VGHRGVRRRRCGVDRVRQPAPAGRVRHRRRPADRGRPGGIEIRSRVRDVITLLVAAGLVFAAFFLVRTCGPPDAQFGGGRAASCPATP